MQLVNVTFKFYFPALCSPTFQFQLLALQFRLLQGQIEEIPSACVRTSQLCAVITGVLDIWCGMGMVTFSVCLLAHPHPLCAPALDCCHLRPLRSWEYGWKTGGSLWRNMWSVFESQLVPWDWLNIYWPNGALSLLWSEMTLFDGTCCPGEDREKGEGHRDVRFGPIYNCALPLQVWLKQAVCTSMIRNLL